MVEDSTMACQYFSGSGTNQLVFRGLAQTNAAAGYLAFNGAGVGDGITPGEAAIVFDGTSALDEEDGNSSLSIMQESGTGGNASDRIVLDSIAAITAKVNGAITTATTALVLDNNSGTIAVGQKVYSLVGATSLTDGNSSTAISQDGTLTVTAVASQNSITVSKSVTVADNVDLNFSADGHDEILSDSIDFTVQGVDGATNIMTGVTFTGGDADVKIGALEDGTDDATGGTIILDATDGSGTDTNDAIVAEDASSDIAVYTEQGSTSGSAQILMGVTVAAS
jgi:hypothetical protein